jgi:hypothetical protein
MDKAKVRALTEEIIALPEGEREQLAREILPLLLGTRAGLEGIDQALQALSDKELDAWSNELGAEVGISRNRSLRP